MTPYKIKLLKFLESQVTGMPTKTGPPIGCQAESLLTGTAEGARDVETQRLTHAILYSTFINICNTHYWLLYAMFCHPFILEGF